MAELVARYPDRFVGAAACLPLNDVDAALARARSRRSISSASAACRSTPTSTDGRSTIRSFVPFFDRIAALDIPILLHPVRGADRADYPTENVEPLRHAGASSAGCTTPCSAMARLVFSGLFDRHPQIKIVTHHLGGFAPYASERIREGYDKLLKAARARNEPIALDETSVRVLPRFLRRHDHDRLGSGAAVRHRLLRRRTA